MVGSGWQHRTAQTQTVRPLQPQNNAGTAGAPQRGSLLGRSLELIASKKKWDTVALLLARKSLKTKKDVTHKVGHFFDRPKGFAVSPANCTQVGPISVGSTRRTIPGC